MTELTKEYLNNIRALVLQIRAEQLRVSSLRSKLYSPQGLNTNEKVQSSGNESGALADIVCDMQQKLDEECEQLEQMKHVAEVGFGVLSDEQRQVMILRYLCALEWPEIRELMHYSAATVYRRRDECFAILFGEEKDDDKRTPEARAQV